MENSLASVGTSTWRLKPSKTIDLPRWRVGREPAKNPGKCDRLSSKWKRSDRFLFTFPYFQVENKDSRGIQIQTHPNVDKELFRTKQHIALKNASKPFPLNTDVGVLKWRFQTQDENLIPLNSNLHDFIPASLIYCSSSRADKPIAIFPINALVLRNQMISLA